MEFQWVDLSMTAMLVAWLVSLKVFRQEFGLVDERV